MTLPLWCLVATVFIPYIISVFGALERNKLPEGLDNKHPRKQALQLDGFGARAYAAQANAWEALGVFTVAVIVNHLAQGDAQTASWGSGLAAMLFVGFRFGHMWAYLTNKDVLRGAFFFAGFICSAALVVLGALA